MNYKTLYWHFTRFVQYNVFLKLFNKIKNYYSKNLIQNDTLFFIDSTSIPNKQGINKIGRNKFYKNKKITKLSLMTDVNGFPLSVLFMKGNYHDTTVFDKHIRDAIVVMPNKKFKIVADKAYASHKNYTLLNSFGIPSIIPPRKNMKIAADYQYDYKSYNETNYYAVEFEVLTALASLNNFMDTKVIDAIIGLMIKLQTRKNKDGLYCFEDHSCRLDITGHVLNGYYNLIPKNNIDKGNILKFIKYVRGRH